MTTLLQARAASGGGHLDECLRLCAEAEDGLTEPTLWRARLLETRATTLTALSLDDQSRELLAEAWTIYERLDDTLGRASVRQNTATLAFQSAETSKELYEEALELVQSHDADDLVGVILLNLENIAEKTGAPVEERIDLARRARTHLDRAWPSLAVLAQCVELSLHLHSGDVAAASALAEGLPDIPDTGDPGIGSHMGDALADLATARGDDTAALACLDRVLDQYVIPDDEVVIQEARADVLERLGRMPDSLDAMRRAVQLRRDLQESSAETAARALDVWHRASMLRQDKQREKERADELERALRELRRASLRIHELSIRDTVTGLHNRQYLMDTAPGLLAQAGPHAPAQLALIDLDRFKVINDSYGHASGDIVLRQFASRLREHLPASDLVVRHGGEEFVVVRPSGAPRGSLAHDLDGLRPVLAHALWRGEDDAVLPPVTMSAGVTDIPNDAGEPGDVSLDSALARADALMYRAKSAGRDRVLDDAVHESTAHPG